MKHRKYRLTHSSGLLALRLRPKRSPKSPLNNRGVRLQTRLLRIYHQLIKCNQFGYVYTARVTFQVFL
ncbi:MAG: hypothetical protein ACI9JR_000161 [Gammaproteobacteria bacterium]|jgi:hypothetical protein